MIPSIALYNTNPRESTGFCEETPPHPWVMTHGSGAPWLQTGIDTEQRSTALTPLTIFKLPSISPIYTKTGAQHAKDSVVHKHWQRQIFVLLWLYSNTLTLKWNSEEMHEQCSNPGPFSYSPPVLGQCSRMVILSKRQRQGNQGVLKVRQ